jgi:hypothetical protein
MEHRQYLSHRNCNCINVTEVISKQPQGLRMAHMQNLCCYPVKKTHWIKIKN